MFKKIDKVFEEFKKPFKAEDIEWRIGRKSKDKTKATVLAYMNARAVQERLDEACGPENWEVSYEAVDMGFVERHTFNGNIEKVPVKGFVCKITIKGCDEDGNILTVTRQDGAQCTDFEPVKGGLSGSFKRAATQFGIGRYLYNLKETWVPIDQYGNFKPPALPAWALPEGTIQSSTQHTQEPTYSGSGSEDSSEWDDVPWVAPIEDSGNTSDPMITFGKYNGKRLSEITDEGYIAWLSQNARDESVRQAAMAMSKSA